MRELVHQANLRAAGEDGLGVHLFERPAAILDDAARHRLRKCVKRLRYLSEFAAPAFRAKRVRAFLQRLTPAQQALGRFNDVCVAQALFGSVAAADPLAMFALGWLAHERDAAITRCVQALAPLRRAEVFWP